MKRVITPKNSFFFVLFSVLLFFGCDDEVSENRNEMKSATAKALTSEDKIAYLVENLHQELPAEDILAMEKVYRAMTLSETEQFIQLMYEKDIREGEDAEVAESFKDFRLDINRTLYNDYQQTIANATNAPLATVHEQVYNSGKHDLLQELEAIRNEEARVASEGSQLVEQDISGPITARTENSQTCGTWFQTGTVRTLDTKSEYAQNLIDFDVYYSSPRHICNERTCQSDCDYLFYTNWYWADYYSSYVVWKTFGSRLVLTYANSTAVPSYRRAVPHSSGRLMEQIQFMVGMGRVDLYYSAKGAQGFADEIKVKLSRR